MLRWLRDAQVGAASPRAQHVPASWSTTLVKRLRLERHLEGHDGCVNTVHFSPDGELLVSGSDDMQIFFWDWQLGTKTLGFHSGHHNNVFQARIMPHSANGTVVSCAADGLVRVAHIPPGTGGGAAVETRRLACHRGRAHKLALEPGSASCFLSCGEDGEVRHFDLREAGNRRLLACRTQRGSLELNSVHCRPGTTQFCVAGGDPFVRVYDLRRLPPSSDPIAQSVRRLAPWHLRSRRSRVTITCAVFGQAGEVLATYNDENVYLFSGEEQPEASNGSAVLEQGRRHSSNGGSSSGRPVLKRARRSGGSGGSGRAEPAAEPEACRQQRRAAAAAALAQQQRQRAVSGAAAAAEAHASMRRGLIDDDLEPHVGPPLPPPAVAAAAGGRSADAAWLDSLVPPPGSRRQGKEEAGEEGAAVAAPAGPLELVAGAEAVEPGSSGSSEGQPASGEEQPGSGGSGGSQQAVSSSSDSEDDAGEWGDGEGGMEAEIEEDSELDEEGEEEDSDDDDEEEEWEDEGELPQGALVDNADMAVPGSSQPEAEQRDGVLQSYKGHRNYRTVKGVSFLGQQDEFVMSGSDCGHVFIWNKASGAVQAVLKGDHDTVNCLEPHPHHLLTVATSGIDDTIKLWTPSAEEPQVIGAEQERVMAANQREQGEERRMFITPQMLQMLLRAGHLGGQSGEDEGSEEEGSDIESSGGEGEGRGRRRRLQHGDTCVIS